MINSQQTRARWELSQLDKTIHKNLAVNIILNGGKPKAFPLRSGAKQECLLSTQLFNIVLKVLFN